MTLRPAAVGAVIRRDLRLLWIYVVLFPVLTLAAWAAAATQVDALHHGILLTVESTGLPLIVSLAMLSLAVAAVQVDPIGGPRQDWLTRPLGGTELVAAKAVFIAAFVFLPYAACQVAIGAIEGAPIGASLLSVLSDDWKGLAWLLPLLMFAGLTASRAGAALVFCALALQQVAAATGVQDVSGARWLADATGFAALTLLSLWTLWLAYGRRTVTRARLIAILGVAALLAASALVPSRLLATVQQTLSRNAAAADTIRVTVEPGCFPARSTLGPDIVAAPQVMDPASRAQQIATQSNRYILRPGEWSPSQRARVGRDAIAFRTRLALSGVPLGSRLIQDDARASYVDAQGSTLITPILSRDHARFFGPDITRWGSDNAWLVSRQDAQRLGSARLRLDQAFTLLEPIVSYSLPDDGRTHRMPWLGWCRLGPGKSMGGRALDCLVTPGPATMIAGRLGAAAAEHTAPDYAPNLVGRHVQFALFLDNKQLVANLSGPTPLTATVTAYRATAHFQRRLIAASGALGGPACPLPSA
jgi:hypothetical protein